MPSSQNGKARLTGSKINIVHISNLTINIRRRTVQKVWSMLYSYTFVTVDVPVWVDEQTRQSIISYFGQDCPSHSTTPLKHLRTLLTKEELNSVTKLVSVSSCLVDIQIRRGATDHLLHIIGRCCPLLQQLNV